MTEVGDCAYSCRANISDGDRAVHGRKDMSMECPTFLIDGNGVIQDIWRKVKVPGHVEEVLKAVKAL